MIALPKNWFKLELYKKLRALVRGPISRVRRRMVTLKTRLPAPIFKDLTSNLNEGDGVQWDAATGDVLPTKRRLPIAFSSTTSSVRWWWTASSTWRLPT